jgi:hypothetical protein
VTGDCDFLSENSTERIEGILESLRPDDVSYQVLEDFDMSDAIWKGRPNPRPVTVCPKIGTRVVSISSLVGFGEFGTVIGRNEVDSLVWIAFDNEVDGATTLDGQLKTKRGVRLPLDEIEIV